MKTFNKTNNNGIKQNILKITIMRQKYNNQQNELSLSELMKKTMIWHENKPLFKKYFYI